MNTGCCRPSVKMTRHAIGLVLGPLLFALILLADFTEISWEAKAVAATTVWIACWWVTEPIPIPATSLLPIILFPALGVLEIGKVTAEYGNQIIFLIIGGFLIGIAMEKWRLHIRIALDIIRIIGTSRRRIIAGFMVGTAFLSAWISNSAAAMMIVPVALAVICTVSENGEDKNFNTALLLSVAYAASIGGIATIIGTTPNLIFAGMYRTMYGTDISFFDWAVIGVPLAVFLLVVAWGFLVYIAFPQKSGKAVTGISDELRERQPITLPEKRILAVFFLAVILWSTRTLWDQNLPWFNDSAIAIFAALFLFLIPAGNKEPLLVWKDAEKLPWEVIFLLGGGMAIARGFVVSGLDLWIAQHLLFLGGIPVTLAVLVVVTLTMFLTELTTNTATATIILPVAGSLGTVLGFDPIGLMIAAAIASSLGFMMPVATPPNDIVYSTGHISILHMAGAGLGLKLICIVVVTLFVTLVLH